MEEGELLQILQPLAPGLSGIGRPCPLPQHACTLCVDSDPGALEAVCHGGPAGGHGRPHPCHLADCGPLHRTIEVPFEEALGSGGLAGHTGGRASGAAGGLEEKSCPWEVCSSPGYLSSSPCFLEGALADTLNSCDERKRWGSGRMGRFSDIVKVREQALIRCLGKCSQAWSWIWNEN